MSQIIKAFMAFFMVLYMMVSATGILGAFFQTLHAQNLHAAILDELENSNYAVGVLSECFEVSKEAEYALEITLYPEHEAIVQIADVQEIPDEISAISMARVILKYPFQIAFFEVEQMQELCGYAR